MLYGHLCKPTKHHIRRTLIDLDPQGSAHDWNESRAEGNKLDAIKANPGLLATLLKQARAAGADIYGCRYDLLFRQRRSNSSPACRFGFDPL
jgi:hypothetical protein